MFKLSTRKLCLAGAFTASVFSGYAQTLFYQSFDTAWTTIASLPGWGGTASPANSCWHKSSYTTGWTSGSTGSYTAGGANGTSVSARFHSCGAASGALGNIITPSVDCSGYTGNKKLVFYYMNGSSGADELDVYVSYNGGATWSTSLLRIRQGPGWTRYTVPLGMTTVSNLKIKFEGNQGGSAGSSDIGVDEVAIVNYVQSYAGLPYTQDFESDWASNSSTRDVPDLHWNNCPETHDASWRRQNDGASASWGSGSSGLVSTSGSSGSADFHSYNAVSGHFGYMDLYVRFSDPGSKQLSFNYQNATAGDQLSVYLSVDGGQTFGTALLTLSTGSWSGQTVNLGNSTTSCAVLRFMAVSDQGYDDIGIDNVTVEVLSPLPLGLLGFSGSERDGGAALSWEVSSESSFIAFIPERSLNGADFEPLPRMEMQKERTVYTVFDKPSGPTVYYRLRCMHHSGPDDYSETVALKSPSRLPIAVTASLNGLVRICAGDKGSRTLSLTLYDLYGNVTEYLSVGLSRLCDCQEVKLDVARSGIYILEASAGKDTVIRKVYLHP